MDLLASVMDGITWWPLPDWGISKVSPQFPVLKRLGGFIIFGTSPSFKFSGNLLMGSLSYGKVERTNRGM